MSVWQNKPKSVLTVDAPTQQPRHPYNQQGYLPNGQVPAHQGPLPGATPLLPNQGRVIQTGPIRVLCIADVRGMELFVHRADDTTLGHERIIDSLCAQETSGL